MRAVAPRAAGDRRVVGVREQFEHALDRGDGVRLEFGGQPGRARQLVQVPEQPEAGDVGHRVGAGGAGGRGAVTVERRHHLDRLAERRALDPPLDRGRDRAGAERLGQHQRVTRVAPSRS